MSTTDQLLSETLAMVNVVRQAFGKEALPELPDANPGNAHDCLFARALRDVGVQSVDGRGSMTWVTSQHARVAATLWGTHSQEQTVHAPPQFEAVIGHFDHRNLPAYIATDDDD